MKKKYQRVRVKRAENGFYRVYARKYGGVLEMSNHYFFKFFAIKKAERLANETVFTSETIWDSNTKTT